MKYLIALLLFACLSSSAVAQKKELLADKETIMARAAQALDASRIDQVYCAGPLMKSLWEALPSTRRGGYAESAAELAPQLARAVEPGDLVMVKGSNGSKAGAVVTALKALDVRSAGGR